MNFAPAHQLFFLEVNPVKLEPVKVGLENWSLVAVEKIEQHDLDELVI